LISSPAQDTIFVISAILLNMITLGINSVLPALTVRLLQNIANVLLRGPEIVVNFVAEID
jgi:hypothetical protein